MSCEKRLVDGFEASESSEVRADDALARVVDVMLPVGKRVELMGWD